MTDEKQQPSAFPNGNLYSGNRGLTMLDWFAAQAPEIPGVDFERRQMEEWADYKARWAYHYARAMMKAREE